MEFATGALGTLLPKLGRLLLGEYNLHKGAKKNIKFLERELRRIRADFHSVGMVPLEELSEPVKNWASDARELSYDMEDIADTFLVRVQGSDPPRKKGYKKFFKKIRDSVTKAKTQHEIGRGIEGIKERVKELAEQRQRYKLDDITPAKTVDPRLASIYTKVADLVGFDEAREELISRLTKGDDDMAATERRIVSVVGFGGLGKTTLAKAVYDKLQGRFDCTAFFPVGRDPVPKNVFKDILIDLDKKRYMDSDFKFELLDERYFIVIDDIWDTQSWGIIKLALVDNNSGSRVLITTRRHQVAIEAGDLYELKRLSNDNSRKLFFARICGGRNKCSNHQPDEPDEISDKILRKCEGIPLAIITMASLLEGKPKEEWSDVYRSIGFGNKENQQAANTMKILSLSYYDLPPHLRTCLLHLSVFPEDYFIEKNPLIWMWRAEGFVREEQGKSLFEIGEGYFMQLVNRSLIQQVERWVNVNSNLVHGCHIHDMVLELIRSISYQLNFVTTLDENEGLPSSQDRQVRRLALQKNITAKAHMEDLKQVRSFISCGCDNDKGITLSSFERLRVLAINANFHYSFDQRCRLKTLRNLLNLRYLRLHYCGNNIKIAEEIGTLKFLQTLDVEGYAMCDKVVTCLGLVTQSLLCLRLRNPINDSFTVLPDGIRRLTSLEELEISFDYDRRSEEEALRRFMKALGSLRELRVLRVDSSFPFSTEVQTDMVKSLHNLEKMEHLSLQALGFSDHVVSWDTSASEAAEFLLSRRLRLLFLNCISFTRLPSSCINPSRAGYLTHLSLELDAIDEQELTILGQLPELRSLDPSLKSTMEMDCNTTDVAGNGGGYLFFQELRRCNLHYWDVRFLLSKKDNVSFGVRHVHAPVLLGSEWEGVCSGGGLVPTLMSRVQKLRFSVKAREFNKDDEGGRGSLCLEDFASIQNISVRILCRGGNTTEVEGVEAALRGAANVHPNSPKLDIRFRPHRSSTSPMISGVQSQAHQREIEQEQLTGRQEDEGARP